MLHIALHSSLRPMLACRTSLPDNLDPDAATPAFLIQGNFFDNQPDNLLAVRRCCRCGVPKSWQILTERQYLLPIIVGDRDRLLAKPRTVFLFDLLSTTHTFFPDPLIRASN